MDQLGVVTTVLVLSTLLTSLDDIRKFWRRKFGANAGGGPGASSLTSSADPGKSDGADAPPAELVGVLMADLESEDDRRVSRALSLIEQTPASRVAPLLIRMLRHPREEVAARAAAALLRLSTPESVEPLYLYFNARASRAVSGNPPLPAMPAGPA